MNKDLMKDQEYETKRQQYLQRLKEHLPIFDKNTGQEWKRFSKR